ncbi:hypothetical protein PTSG_02126 [Salpingoeca rosetta]|uniref:NADH-ubiquinone oxidoreductase B14 subunit n=1 Tax=Salpingoeca rosetta (strain ATCC 50818 / BSB-021) TaxID=946362 RepID=F2U1A2_SALR5|nr:uncharacterized protein PTSG_02126 [Salpingoeca rosetta]EGD81404.1 hypothetical protein PTSG_02126 [Salpingoeca rosetta]|eukprot:XP_004996608.1 hypothetical protein PTSG_02126 [Salpingoeca rosetta]
MSGKALVEGMISPNKAVARTRVIGLYRAWFRSIPEIIQIFRLEKTPQECRDKLKEKFMVNKDVDDVRVIDMLTIKGQMELDETMKVWKQKTHVMRFWEDPAGPKPQPTFLEKFLKGR